MRLSKAALIAPGAVAFVGVLWGFQQPFREYPGVEYENFPKPPDWNAKTEWAFARLMYPPMPNFGFQYNPNWKEGASNWTIDYPRSDRHLAAAVRRLTRIDARSVEQPVDLDENEQYDWPWLYGVEVGHWNLTDAQAKGLREFLLRGGFFMCDDFHGTQEWAVFVAGMRKVFPDRPIVEIPDNDPIFHTVYDLNDRYQVPGAQFLYPPHHTYEKDGVVPHWRGIYDDHGRVMAAMTFNMDLGDSWEHADNPEYPERFSALGLRIGINYITYAMTH
ncbi:MAG TPA: DUF4159 domain-containing protein [Bryobacteraceae bacterium]|nr:DUF4159 domain-containing protein [Bryobacteraceae bacterium]